MESQIPLAVEEDEATTTKDFIFLSFKDTLKNAKRQNNANRQLDIYSVLKALWCLITEQG